MTTTTHPFDAYEIHPCRRYNDFGIPDSKGLNFEQCDPADADVWTLYGHLPEGGLQTIGDFTSREDAEAIYQRITGETFGTHEQVVARVRLMQSAGELAQALRAVLPYAEAELASLQEAQKRDGGLESEVDSCEAKVDQALAALAEATGQPHVSPTAETISGNARRAAYAHELLSASEHYDATDPNGVRDLLSDLMHLCVKNEWNFVKLLDAATDNFNAELLDPECNGRAAA